MHAGNAQKNFWNLNNLKNCFAIYLNAACCMLTLL